MGSYHDAVLWIRSWLFWVHFKLEILHQHSEEDEDAALGQRHAKADPLADSKWNKLNL